MKRALWVLFSVALASAGAVRAQPPSLVERGLRLPVGQGECMSRARAAIIAAQLTPQAPIPTAQGGVNEGVFAIITCEGADGGRFVNIAVAGSPGWNRQVYEVLDTLSAAMANPAQAGGPPAGGAAVLASGQELGCEGRSANGAQVWPCRIRITRFDAASGRLEGEINWPSLGSVNAIEGQLTSARLTFRETRAIRAGQAYLGADYDLRVTDALAQGTWYYRPNGDNGSITIKLR